jgi:hypothetical protein
MTDAIKHLTFEREQSIADKPSQMLRDFTRFCQKQFGDGYALTGASFNEVFMGINVHCTFTKVKT